MEKFSRISGKIAAFHREIRRILPAFILLAGLLGGCGAAPVITPTAAVIGASASVCTAIDCLENENIQVISKECLWYKQIKLSEEGKVGLTRDDKEQIAYNNLAAKEKCP